MATKLKVLKLLQETSGLAEVTNRRPAPRTPGLFLLQMRSSLLHVTPDRAKRTIRIDMQSRSESPWPIQIKHLQAHSAPL